MKGFQGGESIGRGRLNIRFERAPVLSLLLLAIGIAMARPACAQVQASAERGGVTLAAGGTFSYNYVGYGQRNLLGASAFADVGNRSFIGLEAEGRWLRFNEVADVHADTYLIGPRFTFKTMGRFHPYAKVLVGYGQFTFPYNYAYGTYLVVAPGAGCDFRLNSRMSIRLVDLEYQDWPQFTYGALPAYGVSSGIRFRIF